MQHLKLSKTSLSSENISVFTTFVRCGHDIVGGVRGEGLVVGAGEGGDPEPIMGRRILSSVSLKGVKS